MQSDIFKAADRQILYRRFAVGLAFDVALVVLFMNLTKSEYRGPLTFAEYLMGLVVLWGIQFALWVKTLASAWLALMLEHRALTTQFLEVLRTLKLPPPKAFNCASRFDYLIQLADIKQADADDRVKAAGIYCSWQGIMKLRGVAATLVINRAWDAAISQYNQECPDQT